MKWQLHFCIMFMINDFLVMAEFELAFVDSATYCVFLNENCLHECSYLHAVFATTESYLFLVLCCLRTRGSRPL